MRRREAIANFLFLFGPLLFVVLFGIVSFLVFDLRPLE